MPTRSHKKRERTGESCSTHSHHHHHGEHCDHSHHSHRRDDLKRAKKPTRDEGGAAAAAAAGGDDAPDYSSMSFWDGRYKDGVGHFDWYCNFDHVRPLFERFVRKDSRVLDVGCGDKPLAWDMRDAGYTGKIISFDFSPTVIKQILEETKRCDRKRLDKGVEFKVLDARSLPFEASSFDLVVDKGTVDAMLCDNAGKGSARAIIREAARVVAPGGWFVMVSHIHPSTPEGMELLSETLVPALQDSSYSAAPAAARSEGGRSNGEEGEEKHQEAFLWSVDVHCGGADGDDDGGGEGDSESDGSAGAGGDGVGEGRIVELPGGGEDGHVDGDGDESGQVGPSAYMARKVARKHTRASAAPAGDHQQQRAIPIRIHEY